MRREITLLNKCELCFWSHFVEVPNHSILTLISLMMLPWSLFSQTHYVYNGWAYDSQRCPGPSLSNTLLYVAKNSTKVTQMTDLEIGR